MDQVLSASAVQKSDITEYYKYRNNVI